MSAMQYRSASKYNCPNTLQQLYNQEAECLQKVCPPKRCGMAKSLKKSELMPMLNLA